MASLQIYMGKKFERKIEIVNKRFLSIKKPEDFVLDDNWELFAYK